MAGGPTVAAITGPARDHLWQPWLVMDHPRLPCLHGPGLKIAAANGPGPTKAAKIGPKAILAAVISQAEMAEKWL